MRKLILLLTAQAFLCALVLQAQDQDSPSLGAVARQSRAQKQPKDSQAKDASKDASKPGQTGDSDSKAGGAAKASHVITNDDLPQHAPGTTTQNKWKAATHPDSMPTGGDREELAQEFKSRIQEQRSAIAELKSEISNVSGSIHYVGGECVANCAQWNENQQAKQQQVDSMKAQLEEQQRQLEELQESARKQGFGSSVSDPE